MSCPKCGATSGDNWSQCGGSCPMPASPQYVPKPDGLTYEEMRSHFKRLQEERLGGRAEELRRAWFSMYGDKR